MLGLVPSIVGMVPSMVGFGVGERAQKGLKWPMVRPMLGPLWSNMFDWHVICH